MFLTLFGYWPHGGGGGSPKELVHNLLLQISPLAAQKSKFSKLVLLIF